MILNDYENVLKVAKEIDRKWVSTEYEGAAFPDIVFGLTSGLDVSGFGDLSNLPELLRNPYIASLQAPNSFSDLYYKLFDNGKFFIEVLNWNGSDCNSHDHDFSAIQFQVSGTSLNVEYSFNASESYRGVQFGEFSLAKAEFWKKGSRSHVRPGRVAPHRVSHFDKPTVSLLIRTHASSEYGHQFNYMFPDIAADYSNADILVKKKIGALRLLADGSDGGFEKTFRKVIASQTRSENLFTIVKTYDVLFRPQYIHLLREFSERGEVEARFVRSTAIFRSQVYLGETVKFLSCITREEAIIISVLCSSFDNSSFCSILKMLEAGKSCLDAEALLQSLKSKLNQNQLTHFNQLIKLLDIHVDKLIMAV